MVRGRAADESDDYSDLCFELGNYERRRPTD
jgi:hypothetical protein